VCLFVFAVEALVHADAVQCGKARTGLLDQNLVDLAFGVGDPAVERLQARRRQPTADQELGAGLGGPLQDALGQLQVVAVAGQDLGLTRGTLVAAPARPAAGAVSKPRGLGR